MKRFGFHPNQLHFNMRQPNKVRYLQTKQLGEFEAPMKCKTRTLSELHKNYEKRLDFEKYMNPKGLKPTITSRFKKPPTEIDFVSHEFHLFRSPKPYADNVAQFKVDNYMSKPEIKQYLQKLYNMPVQQVNTFRKQGKVMRNNDTRTRWRKTDWKKAIVMLDHEVEPDFQKIL